jgi:hypothetical protein
VDSASEPLLEAEVQSDHPIVFLFDVGHPDVRVPDYVANEPVAYNDHCLSIGTRYAGDGPTYVRMGRSIKRAIHTAL